MKQQQRHHTGSSHKLLMTPTTLLCILLSLPIIVSSQEATLAPTSSNGNCYRYMETFNTWSSITTGVAPSPFTCDASSTLNDQEIQRVPSIYHDSSCCTSRAAYEISGRHSDQHDTSISASTLFHAEFHDPEDIDMTTNNDRAECVTNTQLMNLLLCNPDTGYYVDNEPSPHLRICVSACEEWYDSCGSDAFREPEFSASTTTTQHSKYNFDNGREMCEQLWVGIGSELCEYETNFNFWKNAACGLDLGIKVIEDGQGHCLSLPEGELVDELREYNRYWHTGDLLGREDYISACDLDSLERCTVSLHRDGDYHEGTYPTRMQCGTVGDDQRDWIPKAYGGEERSCCFAEAAYDFQKGNHGLFLPSEVNHGQDLTGQCLAFTEMMNLILCDGDQGKYVTEVDGNPDEVTVCLSSCEDWFNACGLPNEQFVSVPWYTNGQEMCEQLWDAGDIMSRLRVDKTNSFCLAVRDPTSELISYYESTRGQISGGKDYEYPSECAGYVDPPDDDNGDTNHDDDEEETICPGFIIGVNEYESNSPAREIQCESVEHEMVALITDAFSGEETCCSAEAMYLFQTGSHKLFLPSYPNYGSDLTGDCLAMTEMMNLLLCDADQGKFLTEIEGDEPDEFNVCRSSCDAWFDACGLPEEQFVVLDQEYTNGKSMCEQLWVQDNLLTLHVEESDENCLSVRQLSEELISYYKSTRGEINEVVEYPSGCKGYIENKKKLVLIGIIVGAVIGCLCLGVGGFLAFRIYRRKSSNASKPGDTAWNRVETPNPPDCNEEEKFYEEKHEYVGSNNVDATAPSISLRNLIPVAAPVTVEGKSGGLKENAAPQNKLTKSASRLEKYRKPVSATGNAPGLEKYKKASSQPKPKPEESVPELSFVQKLDLRELDGQKDMGYIDEAEYESRKQKILKN